ncbi:MAG: glycosyltransferase family protein [Rikenellaceae bacterium]
MKYIFVIQGEGRGHLTQAISLSQLLRANGHEVVEVLVGRCSNREIPPFFMNKIGAPVVKFDSPSIDYGRGGKDGDMVGTVLSNIVPRKVGMWCRSMRLIAERINTSGADVVINFYEFLMGFTQLFHSIKPPVITLAHQFIVDHPEYAHRSKSDKGQRMLCLNNSFCARGSHKILVLSMYEMPPCPARKLWVVPPLLRGEIFDAQISTEDFILGYMLNPAYLDEVVEWKRTTTQDCEVHLFWDKRDAPQLYEQMPGLWMHRLDDVAFLEHMTRCKGYITTAGFESVCEAMYLGKPSMLIPAHFEQRINAIDASGAGAGVISTEYNIEKLIDSIPEYRADTAKFRRWVDSAKDQFLQHLTQLD